MQRWFLDLHSFRFGILRDHDVQWTSWDILSLRQYSWQFWLALNSYFRLFFYFLTIWTNWFRLTLIREKKSRIIAGDVTVGTWKMKIICADRVSVRLYYDANFKCHMPLWGEICRAEQKYMPFFGTITERDFRKKIQSMGTYTK